MAIEPKIVTNLILFWGITQDIDLCENTEFIFIVFHSYFLYCEKKYLCFINTTFTINWMFHFYDLRMIQKAIVFLMMFLFSNSTSATEISPRSNKQVAIEDYFVSYENFHDKIMYVDIKFKNPNPNRDCKYSLDIKVFDDSVSFINKHFERKIPRQNFFYHEKFYATVSNLKEWTAETPVLYNLELKLYDKKGNIIDSVNTKIGFRTIATIEKKLYVNKIPVRLKGIEWDNHEKVTDEKIKTLKSKNINALRVDYQASTRNIYDLCDKYGMYVFNELNTEKLTKDSDYHLDSLIKMVEQNKNHPCIIAWLPGNSFDLVNCQVNYKWIKQRDPFRPVLSANNQEQISDIFLYEIHKFDINDSIHTVPTNKIVSLNLSLITENPGIDSKILENQYVQGVFLKNFRKSLSGKSNKKESIISWYSEEDIFSCLENKNEDKKIQPSINAITEIFSPVIFEAVDLQNGEIQIYNQYDFIDLSNFDVLWTFRENNEIVSKGKITNLSVKPRQSELLKLNVPNIEQLSGHYSLTLLCRYKNEYFFMPRDYEIAKTQFIVPGGKDNHIITEKMPDLEAIDLQNKLLVEGKNFTIEFDKAEGMVSLFQYNNTTVFRDGPQLIFSGENNRNASIKANQPMQSVVDYFELNRMNSDILTISCRKRLLTRENTELFDVQTSYVLLGSGQIAINLKIKSLQEDFLQHCGWTVKLKSDTDTCISNDLSVISDNSFALDTCSCIFGKYLVFTKTIDYNPENCKYQIIDYTFNFCPFDTGSDCYTELYTKDIQKCSKFLSAPVIQPLNSGSDSIAIISTGNNVEIYYTLNGDIPTRKSMLYTGPFKNVGQSLIKVGAFKKGYLPSFVNEYKINASK